MERRALVYFPDAEEEEVVLDYILRRRDVVDPEMRHDLTLDLLHEVGATENELIQLCLTLRGDRNRWSVEARSVPGFEHVSAGVTLGAYVRSKCQNPNCSTSEIIDKLGFRNFESLCKAVGVEPPETFAHADVNNRAPLREPRRTRTMGQSPTAQVFLLTPVSMLRTLMEMLQDSGRPEPLGDEVLRDYLDRCSVGDSSLRGEVACHLELPVGSLNAENGRSPASQDPKTESDHSATSRQKKNEPKCTGPDLGDREVKKWWDEPNDLQFPEGVAVGAGSRVSALLESHRAQPAGEGKKFLREFIELNRNVLPSATTMHALEQRLRKEKAGSTTSKATGRKPTARAKADKPKAVPVAVAPDATPVAVAPGARDVKAPSVKKDEAVRVPRPVPIQPRPEYLPLVDAMFAEVVHSAGLTVDELVGRIQDAGLAESMLGYFALRGALAQGAQGGSASES